jgi:hypothetical protein
MASTKRNELIHRLLADRCEICEARNQIEVHHIRKLADLNRHDRPDRTAWVHLMAKRRRNTIVICRPATRTSTRAATTHPPGTDHWRAGCQGNRPARFWKRPTKMDPNHAWHDNHWDGTVCRRPSGNPYCLDLDRIRAERDDAYETPWPANHSRCSTRRGVRHASPNPARS